MKNKKTSKRDPSKELGFLIALTFAVLIPLVLFSSSTKASPYILGAQDRLRLTVYDWRSATDKLFEWTALNAVFAVNGEGNLLLPLVGKVKAKGQTLSQVSKQISAQMTRTLKLGTPLQVGIEVVEYRPVYVGGRVTKPGAYPYRPGLSVLQAVSIAGGQLRLLGGNSLQLQNTIISSTGAVQELRLRRDALLARRVRLKAELSHAKRLNFPKNTFSNRDAPAVKRLISQEIQIFNHRRKAYLVKVKSHRKLLSFLRQEVKANREQEKLYKREYRSAARESKETRGLVNKKLLVKRLGYQSERHLTQVLKGRLQLQTALLKLKQVVSQTETELQELDNNLETEVSVKLRDTEAQLEQTEIKYKTARQLLLASQNGAPGSGAVLGGDPDRLKLRYTIIRRHNGKVKRIIVDEVVLMQPDDTLKVELYDSDDLALQSN